jgi:hypothetical protein
MHGQQNNKIFHIVPAIIEAFVLLWDNISKSQLMEMQEACC